MKISIGARTDAGAREQNEDALIVMQPMEGELCADAIVIVADGMGGRAAGEEASSIAVESVRDTLQTLLKSSPNPPSYDEALQSALHRANSAVFEYAHSIPGLNGMGATCVVAIIGGDEVTIAHIGDSRAYLLNDGVLRRLTEDHSYVHDQMKSGRLSDHDARNSRFRHVITRAVGIDPTVKADVGVHKISDGDSVLLCTDGLSNIVDEAGMIQIMSRCHSSQETVDFLVDAAKRGGSKDNITGVVMRVGQWAAGEPRFDPKKLHEPLGRTAEPKKVKKKKAPTKRKSVDWLTYLPLLIGLICLMGGVLAGYFLRGSMAPSSFPGMPPGHDPSMMLHYQDPQVLLDRPLVTSALSVERYGLVAVDAKTGDLLAISFAGKAHSIGSSHLTLKPSGAGFIAQDRLNRVFVSDFAAKSINVFDPNGNVYSVATGKLSSPQAIGVSSDDTIYVIDAGRLKVLRRLVAGWPGAPPIGEGR
jgi:protein phosphatase